MARDLETIDKIKQLQHLMASDDSMHNDNFEQPSMLKIVPAYTADRTSSLIKDNYDAELGRRTSRN